MNNIWSCWLSSCRAASSCTMASPTSTRTTAAMSSLVTIASWTETLPLWWYLGWPLSYRWPWAFSADLSLLLRALFLQAPSKECAPYDYHDNKPIAPCGAIANSMFNGGATLRSLVSWPLTPRLLYQVCWFFFQTRWSYFTSTPTVPRSPSSWATPASPGGPTNMSSSGTLAPTWPLPSRVGWTHWHFTVNLLTFWTFSQKKTEAQLWAVFQVSLTMLYVCFIRIKNQSRQLVVAIKSLLIREQPSSFYLLSPLLPLLLQERPSP